MELSQLKQFKTIAECGSLTSAAEKLYISQPALSTMLRKLEKELGVQLFIRKHNRIFLSTAGEIVLNHVNIIDRQTENLREDLELFLQGENHIHISFCSKGIMWYIIPLFTNTYQDIRLTISSFAEGREEELLYDNKEHLLVTSRPLDSPGVECIPFLKDEHYISVPSTHPLAGQESIFITKETEFPEIHYLSQTDDIFCRRCEAFFGQFAPKIHMIVYTDYFLYMYQIRNRRVVSTTTESVMHFRDDGPERSTLRIENPELSLQYYLCYLTRNKKRVQPFLDWNIYLEP